MNLRDVIQRWRRRRSYDRLPSAEEIIYSAAAAAAMELGNLSTRCPDSEYLREAYLAAKRHADEVRPAPLPAPPFPLPKTTVEHVKG